MSKNKNITYNNLFNFCFSCQLNLCPLCTSTHDKTHNIIDYELKNFICKKHFESFFSYCKECRQDICLLCEREHEDHEIISYGGIIPNIDNIKKQMKIFKEKKDEYKNYLDKIIEKLNNIKKDYDGYYIIYNNIINNYASKNRNYAILKNINDISIYINDFINIINKNINENNIVDNEDNYLFNIFYNNKKEESFMGIKPKFNEVMDIKGPKIGFSFFDINYPKFDDISEFKRPKFEGNIFTPKIPEIPTRIPNKIKLQNSPENSEEDDLENFLRV